MLDRADLNFHGLIEITPRLVFAWTRNPPSRSCLSRLATPCHVPRSGVEGGNRH